MLSYTIMSAMNRLSGPQIPPLDPITGSFTGHLRQMVSNRPEFLRQAMRNCGDFIEIRYLNQRSYLVLDPDALKEILHTKQNKYSKMARGTQLLAKIGGGGLLTSEGQKWKDSRRVIKPFFSKSQFPRYFELMSKSCDQLIDDWSDKNSEVFDLAPEMTKLTLNILGRSIFNEDFSSYTQTVYDELRTLLDLTEKRILQLWPRPQWMNKSLDESFNSSLSNLEQIVYSLIEKNKKTTEKKPEINFTHALLESNVDFSDEDLRDQIISLMIAGHETTATALCWLFITLYKNPEHLKKVRSEIAPLGNNPITLDDFRNSEFSQQVIKEVLRLYPPFWVMGRVLKQDQTLLGAKLKAGTRIQINPYLSQHNPRYWEDPQAFKPERFSKENIHKIHEYTYLPFGKGARSCIGNDFGTFEIFVAMVKILNNFELEITNLKEISPDFRITLRPDREVNLRLKKLE